MRRGLILALVLCLVAAGVAAAAERHVALISVDGLRPAFYLDDGWETPHLRALMKAGAYAKAAEGVFPTVTYPNHASIATGVRPVRHGIGFNTHFDPGAAHGRWYADAADLRASALWDWAREAGLSTAAVAWPSTVGARIATLVPEQDYFARKEPLDLLLRSSTPGVFDRLNLTPRPDSFKDVLKWDAFLTETAAAIIRRDRPRLLLLHVVEADFRQHRSGLEAAAVQAAVRRIDGHVGTLLAALRDAGIAERTAVIVTGDHGFEPIESLVFPNAVLARAGLRSCPSPGDGWRATVHVTGTVGAVFVNPPGDPDAVAEAGAALRAAAPGHYTLISREDLDRAGAFPNAAVFALEAVPGHGMSGACARGVTAPARGGAHGALPSRPAMATGFVASGSGIKSGVTLERMRLIDVAPTAARLLGLTPPRVEGRVLDEILQ
jgi:predicted AlkP superfamily pyrophosphatase or phosphodiesterase